MKDYTVVKDITLSEYFKIKGIYKKPGSVTNFAKQCGVSVPYISKLVNNQYISEQGGEAWKKVKAVVEFDGYRLIKGNTIELASSIILRENDKLKSKVKDLEKENYILKQQLEDLNKIVKLCKKIAGEIK